MLNWPRNGTPSPGRNAPDEQYARQSHARLERFAQYALTYQRGTEESIGVKPDTARAFMAAEQARGVSPKTWNDTLKLLRATWITLALAAGVPMEVVQRVTGHRTAEVVMKHYFRPGREDFRQVLCKAMPKMLGEGGRTSGIDEMREIIEGMTAKTWKRDGARLLAVVDGL